MHAEPIDRRAVVSRAMLATKGLTVSGVTIVALWCLAEAVLRLGFGGMSPPVRIASREIGETYTPSRRGLLFDAETGRAVPVRFNALGFRGPDRPEQKPDGVRRVAVLGDSMVAGLAVPEPETMCGVLETLLNAAGGPRVEVMNFGVAASSPAQELALYRGLVRRFAPDVVVLAFFSGNDLSDTLYEISDRYEHRIYVDLDATGTLRPREYVESPAVRRALSRSRVYGWLRFYTARAMYHVRRFRDGFTPSALGYLPDGEPRAEKAWALLGAVLAELAASVRADGAELVVLGIPGAIEIDPRSLEERREWAGAVADGLDLDVHERRLPRVTQHLGVALVPLKPAFVAVGADGGDPLYFGWPGHLTERGHRVAAEILAARLRGPLTDTKMAE